MAVSGHNQDFVKTNHGCIYRDHETTENITLGGRHQILHWAFYQIKWDDLGLSDDHISFNNIIRTWDISKNRQWTPTIAVNIKENRHTTCELHSKLPVQ